MAARHRHNITDLVEMAAQTAVFGNFQALILIKLDCRATEKLLSVIAFVSFLRMRPRMRLYSG